VRVYEVAVWIGGCVAVWLCGCVAVWLCGWVGEELDTEGLFGSIGCGDQAL
jgi:hypothetical protein